MQWVRFRGDDGDHYGIVDGDRIEQVRGSPFGAYSRTDRCRDLGTTSLLPPVIPPTFYAVGRNYLPTASEASEAPSESRPVPTKPDVGYRANSALTGHRSPIVVPRESSGFVQYEGELVAVIGRKGKFIPESEALSYVFGYTIGNDISERSWQKSDRTPWRAKNSDTFKPMGPWIETDVSLNSLVTRVRLNGTVVSEFTTNEMVFGVERYISEISRHITLHPGDVIWMGSSGPILDMEHGDLVEIEISGIGVLQNQVVNEV